MADNYLERREQELRESRPKVVRTHPSLESLLKRNRSYRGFDPAREVTQEELKTLQPSIDKAVEIISSFVLAGIDVTMNQYNKLGKK